MADSFLLLQLEHLAQNWVDTKQITTGSQLTSENILAMGHLLCGLSVGLVQGITPSVYTEVSGPVGELERCEVSRLNALRAIASTVYRSSGWSEATLAEIGILAAALQPDEYMSLTEDHISGISMNAFAVISGTNLGQLRYLVV